jgi:hypothetical protein
MEQITCIIFALDSLDDEMAGNSSDIRLWPRLDQRNGISRARNAAEI